MFLPKMAISMLSERTFQTYSSSFLTTSFLRTGSNTSYSLLYSICVAFKEYRDQLNDSFLYDLSHQIAQTCDKPYWFSICNGEIAIDQILSKCFQLLSSVTTLSSFQFLYQTDPNAFDLLFSFLEKGECPIQTSMKTSFLYKSLMEEKSVYQHLEDIIFQYLQSTINQLETKIDDSPIYKMTVYEKQTVILYLLKCWNQYLEYVIEESYQDFRNEIQSFLRGLVMTSTTNRDQVSYMIPFLSRFFNVNILILDEQTGKPWLTSLKRPEDFETYSHFLILLYFPSHHYFESLGKMKKSSTYSKKVLSRFFSPQDPMIITFIGYLETQLPEDLRKERD